jgi:glucose 1-dehydrogenase
MGTMEISLEGQRALVTGGSSGIGLAIATQLAAAGARVCVNHLHDENGAAAAVRTLSTHGPACIAHDADISDPGAVAGMFAHLDEAWGGVDLLVNNAGIDGPRAVAWEADPGGWGRVLHVNLFGAFYCAREALRRMVPRKRGAILNITSVHERIPWAGYSAYAASKAGLSMLTETLAQEAAPEGVRVVALAPGAIQTPINQSVWSDPAGLKDLLTKIPLGRMGRTEEIARMAVVLLSDAASYLTGTTVFVDGGMTDYPSFTHGG